MHLDLYKKEYRFEKGTFLQHFFIVLYRSYDFYPLRQLRFSLLNCFTKRYRLKIVKNFLRIKRTFQRSHKKDQDRFYPNRIFVSFEDFKEKLKYWMREYNNVSMSLLNGMNSNQKLAKFLA